MAEPIAPAPSADGSRRARPLETIVVIEPPVAKKRRRFGWIIALAAIVVLVIAGFVADALAKQFAAGYVKERIVEVLRLKPGTPVDVDLGSGSILLQAATGAISEVKVHVDDLSFGDITAQADLTATSVPLDSSKPVEKLGIVVTVNEDNVQKLSTFISGMNLTSIELDDKLIRVASEIDLTFLKIPVAVDLAPSAKDGGISFDPVTILLGKQEISVADLRASPEFQGLAGDLLSSKDFCVAGYLPKALTLDDVDVVGSTLRVSITGDGIALSDPALFELGSCPADSQ
jgi:hypothetical protein